MDYDLLDALKQAWEHLQPKLEKDPDLLAARLARRRKGIIQRPHRAWCIGVRASDRRITSWNFIMSPKRPLAWDEENHRTRYFEHKVLLDARNLRWLCRPVSIPKPHVDAVKAAEMLGVAPGVIRRAIKRGDFSVEYYKGLLGKRGRPVPMVYTPRLLDPSAFPASSMADIEWGTHWTYPCERLPDDLSQLVERHPRFGASHGQRVFQGWCWVCPGCQRRVHVVYYPLPPLDLAPFVKRGFGTLSRYSGRRERIRRLPATGQGEGLPRIPKPFLHPDDDGGPDDLPEPLPCFACYRCHNIQRYRLVNSTGWNSLVTHLSGGLLTGREVKKPAWFAYRRKRAYCPRPNRAPSRLQPRLLPLLLQTTLTHKQMARHLKITLGALDSAAAAIYRRHHVHTRQALRAAVAQAASQQSTKAAG